MKNCLLVLVILLGSTVCAWAQHPSADEEAIRETIAEISAGRPAPHTTDTVFWSGAYVKPYIQGEPPQVRPGSSAGGNNRTNQKTAVTVRQLRISASGDMAYEYSTFQLRGTARITGDTSRWKVGCCVCGARLTARGSLLRRSSTRSTTLRSSSRHSAHHCVC